MKRILLSLLIVAACKHASSSSSTSHSETQTTTESTSSETGNTTTTTTVETQPGETVTTIDEYDPPSKEEPGSPDESEARPDGVRHQPPVDAGLPPTLPRRGPLRKETVTVTKSGGETTQTRQQASTQAQGATEVKAAGKADTQAQAASESKPAASCVSLGWLWGLAVLVGVVGVLYGVIKFRRAVP